LKVQYFPLSDGKLSRISGRHLNYAGGHAGHQINKCKFWLPKTKFGRPVYHFFAEKIEPVQVNVK
jgi:hypothetical protein